MDDAVLEELCRGEQMMLVVFTDRKWKLLIEAEE